MAIEKTKGNIAYEAYSLVVGESAQRFDGLPSTIQAGWEAAAASVASAIAAASVAVMADAIATASVAAGAAAMAQENKPR